MIMMVLDLALEDCSVFLMSPQDLNPSTLKVDSTIKISVLY